MNIFKTLALGLLTGHYLAILESAILGLILILDYAVEGFLSGWMSRVVGVTEPEIFLRDCLIILGIRIGFGFCAIDGLLWAFLSLTKIKLHISWVSLMHLLLLVFMTWGFDRGIAKQFMTVKLPLYRFSGMPCLAIASIVSPFLMSRLWFIPNSFTRGSLARANNFKVDAKTN
jgi:hypothetical protein